VEVQIDRGRQSGLARSAVSAFTRVVDALWRCAADPGLHKLSAEFVTIPGLQRTIPLRSMLRCARETWPKKQNGQAISPAVLVWVDGSFLVGYLNGAYHQLNL
jgi:hypothetical protein